MTTAVTSTAETDGTAPERASTGRDRVSRVAPRRRSVLRRVRDRALMADPGLVKTDTALRTLLCIPAGMAVGYWIAVGVGLPAVLGIMIGAMPAFITCLVIVDPSPFRVAGRTGAVIVPFVVALGGSIALHPFRLLELALIVVLLFLQFAATAWSKWASDAAMVAFTGYLCGLLLPLPETSVLALGWIAAASLAVTIVIRSVLFRPAPYRTLLRTRRAFTGWSRAVLEAAAAVLAAPAGTRSRDRALRRLDRRRARLQEVALTVDGMLGANGAGATGEALHRLVFDTQLAVDELGRGAEELVRTGVAEDVRHAALRAFSVVLRHGGSAGADAAGTLLARYAVTPSGQAAVAGGGSVVGDASSSASASASASVSVSATTLLVQRIARQLIDLRGAGDRWRTLRDELPRTGDDLPFATTFATPVVLAGGRPAGVVPVLDDTLAEGGMRGPWRRWHITASWRTAIQAAIAVAITEPLALALDGSRFYWGVIGVMIVLAGTNTTHERVRKGIHRGVGTVVGGAVGIVLVHLLGTTHPWTTLILVCLLLAVGTYGFGGVYALWATCLVVVLCQVYDYSGSFTDALIPMRLAENLLGAAVGIGVSVVVLPVATRAVLRSAVRRQLAAARDFVLASAGRDPDRDDTGVAEAGRASRPGVASHADATDATGLRARSRALDAATYQLDAVLKPMVRFPTGGPARSDATTRASLQAVASFARELAGRPGVDDAVVPERLGRAADVLAGSIEALSERIAAGGRPSARRGRGPGPRRTGVPGVAWVRIGDLLGEVLAEVDGDGGGAVVDTVRDRVHALGRIDEALALLAERCGMPVTGARRDAVVLAGR